MPPLIRLLDHGEFDIRKEAVWAISNATSGGMPMQIRFMVARGVIPPLCRLLQVPDPKVVVVALEGLDNILKAGANGADGGVSDAGNEYAQYMEENNAYETLDKLQDSDHKGESLGDAHAYALTVLLTLPCWGALFTTRADIAEKAKHLFRTYFEVDQDDDPSFAPQQTADSRTFAFGSTGQGAANPYFSMNNGQMQ